MKANKTIQKKWKRLCRRACYLFLCAVLSAALALPAGADSLYQLPEGKTLNAASAMVVYLGLTPEQDTVLFEKNADEVSAPAALVRLMVGAYALKQIEERQIDLDKTTGTYEKWMDDTFITGTGIGTASMNIGETWTLRDLLTVSMIETAGDAAVTLAATISGTVGDFVQGMNDLAKEIGCTNTSFANVTGLDSLVQYTCPRDLYLITRYVMDYPLFGQVTGVYQHTVTPVANGDKRTFVNRNLLMRRSSAFYYEPTVFGRTGYTDQSGYSLVSLAQSGGYDYLVIVMGCPAEDAQGQTGTQYLDSKMLYTWAFGEFTLKPLLTKNEILAQVDVRLAWNKDKVSLVPKEEFATVVYDQLEPEDIIKRVVLYDEDGVDAPVEKGTVFGKVELIVNLDQKIGEVELVAGESVERSQILAVWEKIRGFLTSTWFFVGLGLLGVLLVLYIILNIVHNRNRRRNNMQRVKKYK